ncbi:MotB family protein [Jiella sp. M17.18]|uniref:MotB family protein n=1 Tax=Jiella sp. M17.18 TaxID=3234247 RepID=UPI0034DED562
MSGPSEAGHLEHQEIIIVRRGHDDHDDHHGGVWKIAFADFMTAMMAFFLVMWLTNASDTATRKQVAQYFNPIKLSDPSPATRGLKRKDDGADRKATTNGESVAATNGDPHGKPLAGDQKGGEEKALFRDPYAVLAEIAAQSTSTGNDGSNGKPNGSGLPGLNGGDAYRDPFDPTSWQLTPNLTESGGRLKDLPPIEFRTAVIPPEDPMTDPKGTDVGAGPNETTAPKDGPKADKAAVPAGKGGNTTKDGKGDKEGAGKSDAEKLKAAIDAKLADMGKNVPSQVEVKAGDGGVTISLSDEISTGMFDIGSARPTPAAVEMMDKIATVLATRKGDITIRGYTDARPFKSQDYDNWRLSTARAHMAYYMLGRGGLDLGRVKAIEGFADRKLKDPAHPEAAVNRRIEILLTEPTK